MLVRGHSTDDRHIPYISVDVGEIKPFGDMLEVDCIFESEVNVARGFRPRYKLSVIL